MLSWLERLYHHLATGSWAGQHRAGRWGLEAAHALVVLVREARRDRLHVRAAMLAYWTAVALVPILLLGFSLTGPLGLGGTPRAAVRRLLYDTILAESVEEVGGALDVLLDSVNMGALGVFGLVGVTLIGVQLYLNAELAYNDIFQTRVRRSLLLRITLFYAGITLAPTFIAGGFLATAALPEQGELLRRALPLLLTMTAFVGAIRLLPCRVVSWRSSLLGGLISASAFELAKVGFGSYTRLIGAQDSMAGVWGSLAFLPAFLLWLYVLWLIVLIGVEVAWLSEHYEVLVAAQRRAIADPHAAHRQPDALFALGLVGLVCRRFLDGHGPTPPDQLVADSGADPRHVQQALDVLQDAGVLVRTDSGGILPATSPHELTAVGIVAAWRAATAPTVADDTAMARVIARGVAATDAALAIGADWLPPAAAAVHHLPGRPADKRSPGE